MELRISEASEKYRTYRESANQLIDRMSNDNLVVYTTRYRTLAETGGDSGYSISGTDYKVRASTKRRAKRSKYRDSKHKKGYDTKVSKYTTVYY